jgi:hypothetical protein
VGRAAQLTFDIVRLQDPAADETAHAERFSVE